MKRRILLVVSGVAALLVVFLAARLMFAGSGFNLQAKAVKSSSLSRLYAQAKGLEAKGNLQESRAAYQTLMNEYPNSPEILNWQKKIEELNMELLFSPTITPESVLYLVRPADTLSKIAKEFKTTPELIMHSNSLKDSRIFPGQKIKVWKASFSILIDKSQNILILKSNEDVIKTYTVSTGVNNSTPSGNFRIINKLQNPSWFKPGEVIPAGSPENILGSRWIGWDLKDYGIHGTTDPEILGRQVTQGCVRMSNRDVEELYTIVPIGTEVIVVD